MRDVALYVVVPPRALLLDVAGPLEVVRRANIEQSRVRFVVAYVGPRRTVMTSIGLPVATIAPLPRDLPADAIVMIGGAVSTRGLRDDPDACRDARDDAAIVEWLSAHVRPSHVVITICSGALFAARAGLLDGFVCTTHHQCTAELARIAPRSRVLEDRLFVEDRTRLTSAGVTAGIDLMLYVIANLTGQDTAVAVARYLVLYLRRAGSDPQLSPWLAGRNHLHPAVHKVQDALAADPRRAWSHAALAKLAGTSARHLTRLFNRHTGMSLPAYRNRLRIALARELLTQTQLDMESVAERSGFGSTRQLRRAWHELFIEPPRAVRSETRRSTSAALCE